MSELTSVIDSPVGPLRLDTDGVALTSVWFLDQPTPGPGTPPDPPPQSSPHPVLAEARRQLDAYFAGRLREFELPLAMRGTTFQRLVWEQLRQIPFGTMVSYGEIARRLGLPVTASRAVGLANDANPVAIVVPCHRVIGADGKLIGYAGGLQRKRLLLALEAPTVQGGLFES